MSNTDINLDNLLEQINDYEPRLITKIYNMVDAFDKTEKEDYIWKCVDLLRDENFIDGPDIVERYLDDIITSTEDSISIFNHAILSIYNDEDAYYDPINGRYCACIKELDKKKVRALFDEYGDTIIRLTHFIMLDLYWWDDISAIFKNNMIKGSELKYHAESFYGCFGEDFPDKCLSDTNFIKTGENDYYETKINGFGISEIDPYNLGYKNKYGFNINSGYNDFEFIYHNIKM